MAIVGIKRRGQSAVERAEVITNPARQALVQVAAWPGGDVPAKTRLAELAVEIEELQERVAEARQERAEAVAAGDGDDGLRATIAELEDDLEARCDAIPVVVAQVRTELGEQLGEQLQDLEDEWAAINARIRDELKPAVAEAYQPYRAAQAAHMKAVRELTGLKYERSELRRDLHRLRRSN